MHRTLPILALLAACSATEPPAAPDPPVVLPDTDDPPLGDDDDDTDPTGDTGDPPLPELRAIDAAAAIIHGDRELHYFGGMAYLHELTGDGQVDLVVYAGERSNPGVYLLQGPFEGEVSASEAISFMPGGDLGSGIGDLNGDGFGDVAVVVDPLFGPQEVRLYFGPFLSGEPRTEPDASVQHGLSVGWTQVCDADLDGVADLLFPYSNNTIRAARGPFSPGVVGAEAIDVIFEGSVSSTRDWTNQPLCGRDVTGDGTADLLFRDGRSPKSVWVLEDPPWDQGTVSIDDHGYPLGVRTENGPLIVPGDLTGDGHPDLYNSVGVTATLLEGPIGPTSDVYATFEWWKVSTQVIEVGDLDGDGVDDLAVGLASYNGGSGAVFLVHGPIAPAVYEVDDVDLILTAPPSSPPSAALLGGWLLADRDSDLWGAVAGSVDGAYPYEGHVYLFQGWPGP